jgi:hypothetical protein
VENFLSICLGICLSAAVGFKIFVPLLIMSIASLSGNLTLSSGFEWIGTFPALITFSVASIFEIGAYYIPFVDNILDIIAMPSAVIAGTIVMASTMVDVSPLLKWSLAIIAGGSAAVIIKGTSAVTRGTSTATTAGLSNPVLTTAELGGAVGITILGIIFPLIVGSVVIIILFIISKKLIKHFKKLNIKYFYN